MQGVFLGKGQIWAFGLSDALPRIALMVGALALAFMARVNLETALWLQVLSFLVPMPVIVWLALWRSGRLGTALRRLRPMLGYGLIFAFNLFLVTLNSRLAIFAIEAFTGADEAGQFYAAVRVYEIFLEVAAATGMVLFSQATRSRDVASTMGQGMRLSAWFFWLFLAVGVAVASVAPFLLALILGEQYREAAPILQILALSLAPAAATKMIYPLLAGTGRPYFGTPTIAASLALNVVLTVALVPHWGGTGGAAALVAGQYALLAGYAITCKRKLGIPASDIFNPRLISLMRRRAAPAVRDLPSFPNDSPTTGVDS
jgi:O-antigen/teichoic acid export membrane protein